VDVQDPELEEVKNRLATETFMPKLRTKDNSVVPNQLHLKELKQIIRNAANYLSFLNAKDADGIITGDKILQILTFRIPYYVGPLNDRDPKAQNTWVVRRSHEKIYPWNFDEIVDKEMSAAQFINRMTAQCT
ncbi:CRISPR-associated endonuclease Cas9 REC1/REC2 domain-containing protein, partial [Vibrio sp. FNV 38]|nr:CRISPR-associated endonuclease Cas9 REC1/REC2 domain-containing protein [Vibrio sp. FNV 38]